MGYAELNNSDPNWLANVGVMKIQSYYVTQKDILYQAAEMSEAEMPSEERNHPDYAKLKNILEEGLAKFPQPVRHMDTSVGGCDVFNPYWQFCRDDDIVHPIHDISPSLDGSVGLGSIYAEMIQDTQRVLWISCGVPRFSGLSTFFFGDSNPMLATIMRDGKVSKAAVLGSLIGGVGRVAFKIAFLPFTLSNFIGDALTNDIPVTKYYDFKQTMPLYFRLVDSLFSTLAVQMGIINNGDVEEDTIDDQYIPEIVKNNCDIFAILRRRSVRLKDPVSEEIKTGHDLLMAQQELTGDEKESTGFFRRFMSGFGQGMSGVNNFVGFRIEKSADGGEALYNDTGESEIAAKLNGIASEQRNATFTAQAGTTGFAIFDDAVGGVKEVISNFMAGIGGNAFLQTATGNGFFDIPHEWKGSKFTKNRSFSVPLRARNGSNIVILQDLYLPLCMWLAAGMPRAIGNNVYTAPFLVQAYCKGLFSIPLGLIESINIKRGAEEFGWNRHGLPLSLDLDITIKDLTPTMFLSLTDNEISLFSFSVKNTAMLDYLATLAGIGLHSRKGDFQTWLKGKKAAILRLKHTYFSPDFWGYMIGENSGMFKGIYQLTSWRRAPEKNSPINNL